MECKELFIFENGQPLTTPPPQVSFWAFRLTVNSNVVNSKGQYFEYNDFRYFKHMQYFTPDFFFLLMIFKLVKQFV